MIRQLSKIYTAINGIPVISTVDEDVFRKRYFTYCLECTFCHDVCCSYGADIDVENVARLEPYTDVLEAYTHVPRSEWFTGIISEDADYPGKHSTRTNVREGACVFLNRKGRGCMIHSFCLENGIDYHILKPRVCWFFPLTFDSGLLRPSAELLDEGLICMNQGLTLYRATRDEIYYLFGDTLVSELDQLEQEIMSAAAMTP